MEAPREHPDARPPRARKRRRHGHRLYWRIWWAVSASIAIFAVLAAFSWHFFFNPLNAGPVGEALAATIAQDFTAHDATPAELQRTVDRWHRRAALDLAVFDSQGNPVAHAGGRLPRPQLHYDSPHYLWRHTRDAGAREQELAEREPLIRESWRPAFAYRLPDDRWLVLGRNFPRLGRPFGPIAWMGLLALAVGLGAYPVVRRLTRRLERLQQGVERLGGGDLAARVPVEGRDEVAQLAASFNDAAARIEQLMASHRSLLANASHELRSPLARVRMAVELLKADARPDLKEEMQRDIAELDALIDEILLASRLDAAAASAAAANGTFEEVDLTALAAEECARAGVALEGEAVVVRGDARLLRRLVRNLLDNARRYGANAAATAPIEVRMRRADANVVLTVADRGPGVPEAERERIFEPFYRVPGTAESGGGVGLGLSLVRKIAQQHGGSAVCLPRDGGGTIFEIRLPSA
jgi:signal transduction histidine kinase